VSCKKPIDTGKERKKARRRVEGRGAGGLVPKKVRRLDRPAGPTLKNNKEGKKGGKECKGGWGGGGSPRGREKKVEKPQTKKRRS